MSALAGRPGAAKSRRVALRLLVLLAALAVTGCSDSPRPTGPTDPDQGVRGSTGQPALVPVEGLGGSATLATDVNRSHEVVGTAETREGESHAFLWKKGETRDLGTLGGSWSTASDVNDWGQVTGTSVTRRGAARAFFWANGTMYDIGTLGGRESHGVAVNDRGQVVGYSTTESGEVHAFLWSHGRMHDLGTLGGGGSFSAATNDRGQVVGRSTTGEGAAHAFLWSDGEISRVSPPPSRSSSAVDVSAGGHVLINTRQDGRGTVRIWSDGRLTSLDVPTGGTGVAAGINARGDAVGQVTTPSGGTRAVMWRDGRTVPIHDDSLARSGTGTGINDAGQVTGAVRLDRASGLRAFFWSGGEIRTLDPDALDRAPRSTTGVAVTESGAVLGLARDSSGAVRSFLWMPSAPNRGAARIRPAGDGRAGSGRSGPRLSVSGDADPDGLRSSTPPLSADSPFGRALRRVAPESVDPVLSWPRSVAALLDQ